MFPLQIVNDTVPLSLTLLAINACFIHCQSNVKNYSISHKSEKNHLGYKIFHFPANLWLKIQNTNDQKSSLIFFDMYLENYHIISQ